MTFNLEAATAVEILKHIVADGIVDAQEVETLRQRVNQDWKVDRDEAELMFKINRATSDGDEHCDEWGPLFVEVICRYLVFDMHTPGEIDAEEGDWLALQLGDGPLNVNERNLLKEIKRTATVVHGRLSSFL